MLEIPFIKPTSQATDAPQSAGKRQTAPQREDTSEASTFDATYDATEEDAVAETVKDTQTKAQNDDTGENSEEETEEKLLAQSEEPSVEEEDVLTGEVRDTKSEKVVESGGGVVAPHAARGDEPSRRKENMSELPRLDRRPNRESARDMDVKSAQPGPAPAPSDKNPPQQSTLETVLAAKVAEAGPKTQEAGRKTHTNKTTPVLQQPAAVALANDAATETAATRAVVTAPEKPMVRADAATSQRMSSEFSKKLETTIDERRAKSEGLVRSDSATLATGPKQASPQVTLLPKAPMEALKSVDVSDSVKSVVADVEAAAPVEPRTTGTTSTPSFGQVLARAETPSLMARQMAEALQRLPDKPVEIALNPRELGRVRMSISAAEAGITVNVLAERPETLDLMRRNIEQLTVEFEAIGYSNINFAFAEGETQQQFGDEAEPENGGDRSIVNLEIIDEDMQRPAQLRVATGVDIRL